MLFVVHFSLPQWCFHLHDLVHSYNRFFTTAAVHCGTTVIKIAIGAWLHLKHTLAIEYIFNLGSVFILLRSVSHKLNCQVYWHDEWDIFVLPSLHSNSCLRRDHREEREEYWSTWSGCCFDLFIPLKYVISIAFSCIQS